MKPGTSIGGKYRLTRQLGTGAMGVVWAAVNERLAREVAIKLILFSSEELRMRMLREARACGALKHPNIVEVLDVEQTPEGDPYLVMQLLSGETLAELLQRQRRLESPQAARIARDVARALVAAHAAGIVHRDLKPANIFLHDEVGGDGIVTRVVKVLDFGVSKNIGGEADGLATATGGLVGSPAYMSPEQAQARRDIDYRSDLWSLGVVLFEMLTGKRPFAGEASQIIAKIILEPIPSVSQLVRHADPTLAHIVSRCLERDLARRLQTAAQLVELLGPCCEGGPGSVSRPSLDLVAAAAPQALQPRDRVDPRLAPPEPPPARAPLPQAHPPTDDDEDQAPTARIDPAVLARVSAQINAAPAQAPRPVLVVPSNAPQSARPFTATMPIEDGPVPARPLASATEPLRDRPQGAPPSGSLKQFRLGRAPAPSDGASQQAPPVSGWGKAGTMRMSPELDLRHPSTGPLPAPPAPPPPSGGQFNMPSSPSYPSPRFLSPPGATSTTAPLLTAQSATPPPRVGAAGPAAPASRRRIGVVVVAVTIILACTVLTVALLRRLFAPDASAVNAAVPGSASVVATVAAAPPATAVPAAIAVEPLPTASASSGAAALSAPPAQTTATARPKLWGKLPATSPTMSPMTAPSTKKGPLFYSPSKP